jgi:hypothetical protein
LLSTAGNSPPDNGCRITVVWLGKPISPTNGARSDRLPRASFTGRGGRDRMYPWLAEWASRKSRRRTSLRRRPRNTSNLAVDFEKLATDMDRAVSLTDGREDFFIDLENQEELLDIYYHAADVSGRRRRLPIVALIDNEELAAIIGCGSS